jgi:hypothetical protein
MKTSHIVLVGIILLLIGVIIRLGVNNFQGNKGMGPGDRNEYSREYGRQKDVPKNIRPTGEATTKAPVTGQTTTANSGNNSGVNSGVISSVTLPFFSNYTVTKSQVALTDLPAIDPKSHSLGASYATRFSAANETAPNFAGKYSIVSWGCGSSCENGAIVNRETGQILGQLPVVAERGLLYEADSKLLVINPYVNDNYSNFDVLPTHYYEWTGTSFKHVGSYFIQRNSLTVAPKP